MRRTFKWDKKYLHWGVTAFLVVACAVLFYMALNYISLVGDGLKKLMGILSPFIWGLIITWLIAPMVRTFEKELFITPLGAYIIAFVLSASNLISSRVKSSNP